MYTKQPYIKVFFKLFLHTPCFKKFAKCILRALQVLSSERPAMANVIRTYSQFIHRSLLLECGKFFTSVISMQSSPRALSEFLKESSFCLIFSLLNFSLNRLSDKTQWEKRSICERKTFLLLFLSRSRTGKQEKDLMLCKQRAAR